jgi:Phage integrase family
MSAIRKLAGEAADNGLLAPELAPGISRVKSGKSTGIRVGNWLSQKQAQALLSAPDTSTVRGLRDRAILAVLLGCGVRRSEVAALTFAHVQQRDGRWCIVDLVGKHGRVRTAPMPTWVKLAIDTWTEPACVAAGHVFRPVNRAGTVTADRLGEKVVWQMLKQYAAEVGVPDIAPNALYESTPLTLCSFHIPPGATWGRIKPQTMKAIAEWLRSQPGSLVVGMDANSPKTDHPDPLKNEWWWEDEPALLGPAPQHGLRDAFRLFLDDSQELFDAIKTSRPAGPLAISYLRGSGVKNIPCRYDVILVSLDVAVSNVEYLPLDGVLSDHALVVSHLEWNQRCRHV